jgi:vacuolar protein sorting-associated protein VTA1
MPLAIPAELKKISPFVRRAEELDKDKAPESRLVAYYCRQYAVHKGIPLSTSQAAKVCLGHILENLEAEKPAMDNFTREEAAFLCRKFANRVFDKANGEDRMGLANQGTAKTFYAASTFLQMLEQFADDNDTSEERVEDRKRIIYAKWKSTDIVKAIKEGRSPTPGGYGEGLNDDEYGEDAEDPGDAPEKKVDAPSDDVGPETVESDDEGVEMEFPPPVPMNPPTPPQTSVQIEKEAVDSEQEEEVDLDQDQGTEVELGPPPAYPGDMFGENPPNSSHSVDRPKISFDLPPAIPPSPPHSLTAASTAAPPKSRSGGGGGGIFGFGSKKKAAEKATKAQLADATELTRFALAALEDKDADLAAQRLQQALESLGR